MHNGFYKELNIIKEDPDYEDDDFSFMEGENCFSDNLITDIIKEYPDIEEYWIKGFNLYKFLHGYCDVFAKALSDINGLSISTIYEPDEDADGIEDYPDKYHLVHMYCTTKEGYYVDVRGITDSWDEFIKDFTDNGLMNNDDNTVYIDIDKMTEEIKDDEKWCYKLAEDVIKHMYPDYFPEEKDMELA